MIAHKASKLALGGAQFGMRYGIANSSGQPSYAVVDQIFRKANEFGISMIDTAQAYGDSEAVLGRVLGRDANIRVVTKTRPIWAHAIEWVDIEPIMNAFDMSLKRLNRGKVYGLLVHDVRDLLVRGGERLWAWMESTKADGKVQKIGVSVYSPEQLQQLLARYANIELVQLPFNIYDQRFVRSGFLDCLKLRHIEVHSRSAFLQGVLLMAPERLPDQFDTIRGHQAHLHEWLRERGLSPLSGALAICINDSRIDSVVVGCDNVQQFEDIIAAMDSSYPLDLDQFAIRDEKIINPSQWMNKK
jgi:aryl-alcohol dehydrogenase-like predicted oxidoreductase